MLFTGSGSLDAKAAGVSLTAPLFLVDAAASQALTTTGDLSLAQSGAAPALDPTIIGGVLSLTGGSVDVSGTIAALGGSLTLEATTGDLNLSATRCSPRPAPGSPSAISIRTPRPATSVSSQMSAM